MVVVFLHPQVKLIIIQNYYFFLCIFRNTNDSSHDRPHLKFFDNVFFTKNSILIIGVLHFLFPFLFVCHIPVSKIQTQCICTVLLHNFHGIRVVLFALAHLLPILSQHQPIGYEVFEGRLAKKCCGNHQQCVKPTSCLVNTFSYEVSREAVLKFSPPLKGVVHLFKRRKDSEISK